MLCGTECRPQSRVASGPRRTQPAQELYWAPSCDPAAPLPQLSRLVPLLRQGWPPGCAHGCPVPHLPALGVCSVILTSFVPALSCLGPPPLPCAEREASPGAGTWPQAVAMVQQSWGSGKVAGSPFTKQHKGRTAAVLPSCHFTEAQAVPLPDHDHFLLSHPRTEGGGVQQEVQMMEPNHQAPPRCCRHSQQT